MSTPIYTNDFPMQPFTVGVVLGKMNRDGVLHYGQVFTTSEIRAYCGVPHLNPKGTTPISRWRLVEYQASSRRKILREAMDDIHQMSLEWLHSESYYFIVPIEQVVEHFTQKRNQAVATADNHAVRRISAVQSKMKKKERAQAQHVLHELARRNMVEIK